MAVMELWRRRDLEGTVKPEYIDGNFFTQDSVGNLVGVKCYKDGAEVALTGSVTGYCVLPSGETVSVAGTRSGNQASILVPQSALAYTGPLGITLKLIDGNTITTLMSIIVVVYRSKTDTVITPSSQIITDWANQISAALQEVEDASAAQDEKIDDLKSAFDYYLDDTKNIFSDVNKVEGVVNRTGGITVVSNTYTTDFLPCSPETTYVASCIGGAPAHFTVIGFYQSDKTFISRITDTSIDSFTTPQACYYVRFTSIASYNGFREKTTVCDGSNYPYVPHKKLKNIDQSQIIDIKTRMGLLNTIIETVKSRMLINASNVWGSYENGYHITIPVIPGEMVTMVANSNNPAIYAFLKTDGFTYQQSPDFDNVYEIETTASGEQTVIDTGVKDTRHVMNANTAETFVIPQNTHYLYLAINYQDTYYVPEYLKISNNIIFGTESEESSGYSQVFFDDFDKFDITVWRKIEQDKPDANTYNSRFLPSEVNIIDSCLVLSCRKSSDDNGTYIDAFGNRHSIEYVAGYVSSDIGLAIKSGRISAKIKATDSVSEIGFPWCFWTFGQDNEWPIAHETDIIETFNLETSEAITTKDGTVIPAGASNNFSASSVHYRKANNNNATARRAYAINYTISNQNRRFYTYKDIDFTQWHEFATEWDEEKIIFYVDGEETYRVKKADLDLLTDGFIYPQDIRFNIKATKFSEGNESYLFVDWVKVETLNLTPAIKISHSDVSLSVGQSMFINPIFNDNCTNQAYEMISDNDAVVAVERYNNSESGFVYNKIVGKSAGNAIITITTPSGISSAFNATVS